MDSAFKQDMDKYKGAIKGWYLKNQVNIQELYRIITYDNTINLLWKNTLLEMFLFEFSKQMWYVDMIWEKEENKDALMYRIYYNTLVTNVIPSVKEVKSIWDPKTAYHKKESGAIAKVWEKYVFMSYDSGDKRFIQVAQTLEHLSPLTEIDWCRWMFYFYKEPEKLDILVATKIYVYKNLLVKGLRGEMSLQEYRWLLEALSGKELIVFIEHIVLDTPIENISAVLEERAEDILETSITKLANTIK